MAIHGALNNAVSGQLIREVLQDSLSSLNQTALFVKALAKQVPGPAGNDIDIVHKLNLNKTGSYRGSPVILDVQKDDHYTGTKALWSTGYADVAIEGDELQNNTGMTTDQIMSGASLPDTPRNRERVVALFSIAKNNLDSALTALQNQHSQSVADRLVGEEHASSAWEGLPTVLDQTAELHGLGPDGLGSFDAVNNPWFSDPPNNQTGDAHLYKNVPQVYSWSSSSGPNGDGTINSMKHDVIDLMSIRMSAAIPGYWLCPASYTQFTKLIAADQQNDMIPRDIGFNKWKNNVRVLEYNRHLFYYDAIVPNDELWGIHIGELDGTERGRGGGFQMCEWIPPNLEPQMSTVYNMMMKPTNPTDGTDMMMSDSAVLPVWTNEFTRDDTRPDTIYTRAFHKYSYVTHYRWKNWKIEGLPTS